MVEFAWKKNGFNGKKIRDMGGGRMQRCVRKKGLNKPCIALGLGFSQDWPKPAAAGDSQLPASLVQGQAKAECFTCHFAGLGFHPLPFQPGLLIVFLQPMGIF